MAMAANFRFITIGSFM